MQATELSPAVKHLVQAAKNYSLIDFAEEIKLHEGKYAGQIIEEALEAIDAEAEVEPESGAPFATTLPANLAQLRRKLREIKREEKR